MSVYSDYIKSEEWADRRLRYYSTHKKECKACGSKLRVNLHHKTYVRLGAERDADLVPLCEYHHMALHKKVRKQKLNLWRATEEYIRNVQKVRKSRKGLNPQPTKRKRKNGRRSKGNSRQRKS